MKDDSVMEGGDENGSPVKPAPIKIPDHDVEVSVSSLPSLKGNLREENGVTKISGMWAMNDFAHSLDGQTSEFEYRLVERDPDSADFPPSGKYSGWFHLKHPAPKPGHIKIDDKDTVLFFTSCNTGGNFQVSGEGQNKFGRFSIHGTLSSEGKLHVYKIFKKKPLNTPKVTKSLGGIKPLAGSIDSLTPREGRVRRPSAVLSGVHDVDIAPVPRNIKQPALSSVGFIEGRAQRLSVPMQKCADLLKELNKHPQSAFFREPVDYVKLCIPDYIAIVKEPMDFQTIQTNLEKSLYQSHEAFAEHVRLVFKNAITYNQRRDHPVHIAARELSNKFEEKYRLVVSQLNSGSDFETNFRPGSLAASVSGERSGGSGRGRGAIRRQSSGGGSRMSAGPRDMVVIPPALDVNMQSLVEMQRAMREMQEELAQIKNQLRQYDIKHSIEIQRQAAHDPMTLEEKQTLVERINRLDEDRMKEVIDIIREIFPAAANGDGEDVDIPIDDLDTLTLRRLQSIVHKSEKETNKRRRSSGTPKQPGAKRSKSSSGMSSTPKAAKPLMQGAPAVQPLHHDTLNSSYNTNPFFGANDDDLDLLGGNDEPVSMDTGMPEQPQRPVSSGAWRNLSEPQVGEDNADYTELMIEVSNAQEEEETEAAAGSNVDSTIVLKNESAWVSTDNNASENESPRVVSSHAGKRWGDEAIQEKVIIERMEEVKKNEVASYAHTLSSRFVTTYSYFLGWEK